MKGAKVLVLMTSPLDKIVHALRVVDAIKRWMPELEVTWVVRRVYEPLVAAFPFVGRTIVFRRSGVLTKAWHLVREIRQEEYDYVFDFEGHARTGAMCFFARGHRKIGLRSAREGATICYREVVAGAAESREHLVDQLREFGSVFGFDARVAGPLSLGAGTSLPGEWVASGGEGKRRVCLFPSRFKSQRAWPEMVELARRLVAEREDVSVFLLGVVPHVDELALPDRVFDLREQLGWPVICGMLEGADLVVANDNGPAQLAGALGARNLTLYSYVSPERRGSYPLADESSVALRSPFGDVRQLEMDTVWAEVEKLLAL